MIAISKHYNIYLDVSNAVFVILENLPYNLSTSCVKELQRVRPVHNYTANN